LFKEGETKFKQTDVEGMIVLCRLYLSSQKKIEMFSTELYQKLKDRLAALRRSL
jgi:hypothetical protein